MTDRADLFFAPLRSLRLASGRLRLLREIILTLGFYRAWPRDGDTRRVRLQHASHGPAVAPQHLRLPRAGEELFRTTVTVH
jgi:hypothetical protein